MNKIKIKEHLQDASKRKYYRIKSNNKSYILLDSRKEFKQFYDLLKKSEDEAKFKNLGLWNKCNSVRP